MRFIGVDLAWGSRGISGLAVLDASGTLLDVTSRQSNDDILDWLEPWVDGPCLVAVDAPLIVTNPTGHRPCDRLIARYFGRYQAFCHTVNLGNPAFADGSRALRIATELGLSISRSPRRVVEVYPHAAIVGLFKLPRILRYKAKPGRDLEFRRSELMRLIGLLAGLSEVPLYADQHDSWQRIGHAVRTATRKIDLSRVEDPIDAVVCAYVALYATRKPSAVRMIGGTILTPVTPEIAFAIDSAAVSSPP